MKLGSIQAASIDIVIHESIDTPSLKFDTFCFALTILENLISVIAQRKLHKMCETGRFHHKVFALPETQSSQKFGIHVSVDRQSGRQWQTQSDYYSTQSYTD